MRILIITEHFQPLIGGNVIHVENLSRSLKLRNHEIVILAPSSQVGACQEVVLDDGRKWLTIPLGNQLNLRHGRKRFIGECRKKLPELSRTFKPDIIHVMYGHYVQDALTEVTGAVKIWTCHNVPPQEYMMPVSEEFKIGKLVNRFYCFAVALKHRNMISNAGYHHVIAVSSSTKKLLVEKAGVREQKITIVPNGVPPDQKFNVRSVRKMQEGRLRLLTVGGLKPHKNIHFIPLIAQSLIRSGIPFDWHIVGGPLQNEYASKIIKQVKALRFENYVHWRGEVSNEDVADEYQNADFYIHLSRQEGFCITVLEALAAGVPVIGTPVGAISEMVRAGSGLVVEPTWRNLESGIKSAISNYESFRRGPDMGRQIQMLYSWDNVAEQTEKLYEQISRRVDK